MMISNVKGSLSGLNGRLIEDTSDPTLSHVDPTIDISMIIIGDAQRDAHLKSAGFFHHEQHPNMRFHSARVESKGNGEYTVTGDLTVHGVTNLWPLLLKGQVRLAKTLGETLVSVCPQPQKSIVRISD